MTEPAMTEPGPAFFDVVLGQRAHRALRPDPVPEGLVEQVIEAATHAPSAENRQPWAFIVVRDETARSTIAQLTARAWEGVGREWSRPSLAPRLFAEVDTWATTGLAAAPVHIVVCGDTHLSPVELLAPSIYPAVQNLLLAALAVGLGSLLSTLALTSGQPLRDLLGLPDHIVPMALVPLGYPARALGPPRRHAMAERTHRERWGRPW